MAPDFPIISFIVINHNGKSFLRRCLNPLKNQTVQNTEILVVDNASTDGSAEWVAQNYPDVRLIISRSNLGYAGGCNLGIQNAHGKWLFLLNSDVQPFPDWTEKMIKAMQENPQVSCFSCTIWNVDEDTGEICVETKGATLNPLGTTIPEFFSDPEMTFYPSGAVFAFPASENISLDPDYFLYYEDVLLGWSLRLRGKQVKKIPEAGVVHFPSLSVRQKPSFLISYWQERNRLLLICSTYPALTLLKILPLFLLDLCFRWYSGLLRKKNILGILLAQIHLLFSPRFLWKKRLEFAGERRNVESFCFPYLSGRILPFPSFWNSLSLAYCRIIRLPVWEVVHSGQKRK